MSLLRESSRQHWFALLSIQIPFSEARPGKYPHASNPDSLPRVIFALPMRSQLKSLAETMPGQFPVPFHSFPRVKQAIPVHSSYNFYSEAKLDEPVHFHSKSFLRVKQAIPVHSQYKSFRKLSRTNRYASTQNHL